MATEPRIVLGFPEYREPAQRLATRAGLAYADVALHRFPDGESKVRLPENLPEHVVLCRSLNAPNSKLIELELAAATALELGAKLLTLVAPYLCYMRQDTAFHPGEAVSQKIIGRLLARHFDSVITVDPHLHRIERLQDAIPVPNAITVSASLPMSDFLQEHGDRPFLIGPDEESEQWVRTIAQAGQFDYAVAHKERRGDREVRIRLPERDYGGRDIVFVDDMISTGHTIEEATRQMAVFKPASISVLVTHALFAEDALARLRNVGVDHIFSTDSVLHPTNRLHLDGLLAGALKPLL